MTAALACLAILVAAAAWSQVAVKLKDLVYVDGIRDNQILGYGLVVGLQGTGDTRSELTGISLGNLLKNLGLVSEDNFRSKNTAAVLITANLPAFARPGDRIDVTVSSINNAKSLEGGILVQSPLRGADDRIYAVAQGPLAGSVKDKAVSGVKTVSGITGGAIVERAVEPEYVTKGIVNLTLKNWDFSVANQILKSVKELYATSEPKLEKGGKISLKIPENVSVTEFISKIEDLEVNPVYSARVVINERSGTIVMGGDIKLSEVMVSREGITVKIEGKEKSPSQGAKEGSAFQIKESASVKDLVDTLNYVGASTKDTIAIIKALKDAGALHAELIIK